ncbi:MAG: hypothetical protein BWY02_02933 [bacterium ADurb.Bin157]|nr:MAG: hypothetical protein BWY02_02933 [bacterium ADurb.Bin157]
MIAYKGFDKNMQCRGYQYKEGEEYTASGDISICENGFHACDNPLDVFKYYRPDGTNKFHVVDCSGDINRKENEDSKFACEKLKVGAEVNLATMIKVGVEAIFKHTKDIKETSSGNYSTGAASGYYSTGAASGYYSKGAASGYKSTGAASGNWSTGAASGNYSTGAASGDYSTGIANGKNSIAVANGYKSKAKGTLGNYLVLTEYDSNGNLLFCKMHKVDGKTIKPDTLYTLVSGKFVEVPK